tara:strand:- start:86 stop:1300 length:1215 start_codon:yes stop_codon:yes gene_type:complete
MSRIRANQITNKGANGAPNFPNGLTVTGIVTASVSASTIGTLAVTGNATIDGNLGVGGTITYEDVARVDATGISTFREGFKVGPLSGIGLTAYKDGSIRTSGIVTAASFVGDGSGLTGAGPSLANGADNRVITASSANALNGEANLTFDGSLLDITTGASGGSNASGCSLSLENSTHTKLQFLSPNNSDNEIRFGDPQSNGAGWMLYAHSSNFISWGTNGAERLRIGSAGQLGIGGANYGSSGQVLTSGGASAAAAWAAASGGKLIDYRLGTSWSGTTAGATSSNKIDLFSQAYAPTDANSEIVIFTWTEIDARTSSYSDRIRIEGVRDTAGQHARWLMHGSFGNSNGSILTLPYIYRPSGWTAGASSTFKVRLWSDGSSGSPSDQYNVRVHESSYYLLVELAG